jgi:uncharacterized protein (UPF0548 family)
VKLSDLAGRPLTYSQVGATAGEMPADFRQVRASRRIGSGRERFDAAAAAVMHYGMLRGGGLRVVASTEVAEVGSDVLGRLGPFLAPCRVVYMFAVRYDPADNGVYAEVAAFSRAATWWSRLGAPVLSAAQKVITRRYLRAV